jgi:zinc protease
MTTSAAAFAYPGPDNISRTVLENGLVTLIRENRSAPITVVEGYLPAGNIHDPADLAGLSAFVAGMLTRGSEQYDFAAFNEAVEGAGASLSFHSDCHVTNFGLRCLSENFADLLAILADAMRRPTFPDPLVERLRNQKLIGLQEREQDTAAMANLRLRETLYGPHPYGRAISGYPETVRAIGRDDLAAFHAQRYTPRNAILVISGDVESAAAVELVDRLLGDWRGEPPAQFVAEPAFPVTSQRIDHMIPGKFQADIAMGVPAVARSHADYYAVRVANTILGVFGLMGRLGEAVREEQGLAYYAYSSQEAESRAGMWSAAAGVNPAQVEQALAAMHHELERLAIESVAEEELADSQAYLTGIVPLTLETNDGVASTLLNMEWHGLGLDYLIRYPTLINEITPADVQRVARTYLTGPAVTVVAGPGA